MPRLHSSVVAFATSCLVSLAIPFGANARAQDVLLDVKSPAPNANAMWGIAIGDWDGDGTADLAIGAPADSTVATAAGAVRVHSGKDGSVLAAFYGVNLEDFFGDDLARMPDLDGDGIDDLAITASEADNAGVDTGSVYVYAGRTGALLFRIDGPTINSIFGGDVGPLSDVDGDGITDLHASQSINDRTVDVFSGADGHLIVALKGPQGEAFGVGVTAIDDQDGDGVQELLIGAARHSSATVHLAGAAYIVSPVTGATLRTHEGTYVNEYLGWGLGALDDLDGDGVHDYAVSALWDDSGYASKVVVYSGASGAELGTIRSASKHEWVGTHVAAAGDLNGDGVGDLAIDGSWFDSTGMNHAAAFLVSGRTLTTLDRIDLPSGTSNVAPFGDLNGDGFDDLIVGNDFTTDGDVQIYAGDDLWLEGTPSEAKSGDLVELNVREGAPGTLMVLVLEAIDGVPTFQVLGGLRSFGPAGGNKLYGKVAPGLAGHDFTLRAYANGPAGGVIASATQTITCK